jgi:AtzE family amidohydrolase
MPPFTTIKEHLALLKSGRVSARETAEAAFALIDAHDAAINSFTALTRERALTEADVIDSRRMDGEVLPPLAGVPYALKNLFDIEGLTTLCGAKVHANNPPATRDGTLVRRMQAAGATLIGALNMDAYAYGFTTENTHYGVTRNPHDPSRVAGGSSGGSGAALAAGFVPVSLGSDTNGSIRVPSSFCGTFGLKPTFGRLTRAGSMPFVPSLDHLGPFCRSAEDLAIVYDAIQGHDPEDPACAYRPIETTLPTLKHGVEKLRIGVLGGHFRQWADADARDVVARAAQALGAIHEVELPEAHRARAAAFIITASEAGSFYLDDLRNSPEDFEPLSRERLTAGALVPADWYLKAQRFRRWFADAANHVFEDFDLLIAPATPRVATPIGAETMDINGVRLPVRPNIGLLTQPISFIGLPVVAAPLWTAQGLPLAVQLIAPPWREDLCLRAAWVLEQSGLSVSRVVQL